MSIRTHRHEKSVIDCDEFQMIAMVDRLKFHVCIMVVLWLLWSNSSPGFKRSNTACTDACPVSCLMTPGQNFKVATAEIKYAH